MSDRAQRAIGPSSATSSGQPEARIQRAILSVAPGGGVSLRGLGAILDQAESVARIARFQVDDRVVDPASGEPRLARPGYANADPWYDGRGHNGTIVDSPRSGTFLTADQIEEIFVAFGTHGNDQSELSLIPAPADESAAEEPRPPSGSSGGAAPVIPEANIETTQATRPDTTQTLARMSTLVDHWRSDRQLTKPPEPALEVFISYSRTCLEWVEANVAAPLADARGAGLVFFDKHHLNAGMDWLATLADSVMACRLFLPIYCPAYFRSDFCQWELQLAVTRDPTGRKRIIAPFVLEPATLPAYCRLIQAQDVGALGAKERIVRLVNDRLS
jgi:hypothetical protein